MGSGCAGLYIPWQNGLSGHSCNTALVGVGFWAQLCVVLGVGGWAYVLCGLVVPCTWGWDYIGVLRGAAVFCIDDWQGYMAVRFPVTCFHLSESESE